jgi:hypothetical protein
MPGFDGTGPMGVGPMTGGGRGFCRPWVAGTRRYWYGLPRRMPYAYPYYSPYGFGPFAPRMTREQELDFLKSEAQALRDGLRELETEIGKLSAEKK